MQQLPFEPHAVINSPFPQLCISDVVSLKSVGGRVNWAAGDDGASQNITQLPQVFSITSFFLMEVPPATLSTSFTPGWGLFSQLHE